MHADFFIGYINYMKMTIYLILSTAGMALIKYGGGLNLAMSKHAFKITVAPLSLIGIICYISSFIIWLTILKQQDLSYIYPISSSVGIVLATLLGFLMGEAVSLYKIAGIILIITGVIIMG